MNMKFKNLAFFIVLATSASAFASAKQTTESFDRLLNVAIQHEMAVTNSQSEDSYFELKEDILTQINELGVEEGLIFPMEELVAQQLVEDMAQTIRDIEELKKEYPPILLAENTHDDDDMKKYKEDIRKCVGCYKDAIEEAAVTGAIGAVAGAVKSAVAGPHTAAAGAIIGGGAAAASSFVVSAYTCAKSSPCKSKKPEKKEEELFKKKDKKEKKKPVDKGKLTSKDEATKHEDKPKNGSSLGKGTGIR